MGSASFAVTLRQWARATTTRRATGQGMAHPRRTTTLSRAANESQISSSRWESGCSPNATDCTLVCEAVYLAGAHALRDLRARGEGRDVPLVDPCFCLGPPACFSPLCGLFLLPLCSPCFV